MPICSFFFQYFAKSIFLRQYFAHFCEHSEATKNAFLTAKWRGWNAETQPRHFAVKNGFWRLTIFEICDITGGKMGDFAAH